MVREVRLNVTDLIGRKVHYDGCEVGHVMDIKGNEVVCTIDSDIVAHMIRGGQASLSLEVVDR